jgi:amino acid transporter
MRKARRTFTLFHVLWVAGTLGAAWLGYLCPSAGAAPLFRLAFAAAGLILGFGLSGVAVFFLVTGVIIPRLTRGSYWSHEVNCYMRHVIGPKWGG